MKKTLGIVALLAIVQLSFAQEKNYTKAIEDNSFLIEEAYNQEDGVVQHISVLQYDKDADKYYYSFTQEWPLAGLKHQLSYDIPMRFESHSRLINNVSVNYRYQMFYKDSWASVSPRFSVFVPTNNQMGNNWGAQVNVPVSKRLSDKWVAHVNMGFTSVFESGYDALDGYHAGGSLIALLSPKFNAMLEYVVNHDKKNGQRLESLTAHSLNPGLRYALDIGGLQIVGGASLPINVSKSGSVGFLFYLSVEHPFRKK